MVVFYYFQKFVQKVLYTYMHKRIIEKTLSERHRYKIEANDKTIKN